MVSESAGTLPSQEKSLEELLKFIGEAVDTSDAPKPDKKQRKKQKKVGNSRLLYIGVCISFQR